MTKSLFDNSEPQPLTEDEIKKIHMIKEEDNKEILQSSGAFFLRGGELLADIRLEFNVKNPKYGLYITKLKDLIKEAEKYHVLLSSSGI